MCVFFFFVCCVRARGVIVFVWYDVAVGLYAQRVPLFYWWILLHMHAFHGQKYIYKCDMVVILFSLRFFFFFTQKERDRFASPLSYGPTNKCIMRTLFTSLSLSFALTHSRLLRAIQVNLSLCICYYSMCNVCVQ